MNILLTGGAGYVGRVTVKMLQAAGHTVTVLDNLSNSSGEAMPEGVRFFEGNAGDVDQVLPLDVTFDAVIHLGALISASESMAEPARYWENNVVQTSQLLVAMRSRNVKKLVFASTAAVYGNPVSTPIAEDAATVPTSVYGATKLATDNAISIEAASYGLGAISFRFFNVAGSYQGVGEQHIHETHLIPLALAAAAGDRPSLELYGTDYPTPDGTCIRDYVHVADLAGAIVLALDHLTPGTHRMYNLGNGTGFTNRQVLEAIARVTGSAVPVIEKARRDGDPAVLVASNARATTELGWQPAHSQLETIIHDAWNFYRATHPHTV